MDALKKRISVEKGLSQMVIKYNVPLESLSRNDRGKILSFTPRSLLDRVVNWEDAPDDNLRYYYGALSNEVHSNKDERALLEEEIFGILNPGENRWDIFDFPRILGYDYTEYEFWAHVYGTKQRCSKKEFNRAKKLIRKWQDVSQSVHYKLTKQEKRKLKKLVVDSGE